MNGGTDLLNRYEKNAIFNLTNLVIAILLFFILLATIGFTRAQGAFGMIGLIGVGHLLFLRRRNPLEVIEDERDTAIKLKASGIGYSISLVFFIISSLAIFFTKGETGVVSVKLFPLFAWIGWAVYIISSSIITLVQYRRGTTCGTC